MSPAAATKDDLFLYIFKSSVLVFRIKSVFHFHVLGMICFAFMSPAATTKDDLFLHIQIKCSSFS